MAGMDERWIHVGCRIIEVDEWLSEWMKNGPHHINEITAIH
jgi:hypothetical protein